jgi:hypothetical protein
MKLLIKDIDKANHFIVGTILYCFFVAFLDPTSSFLMVYLVGFMKEYFDDKPDMMDAFYTALGALPIFILLLVKNYGGYGEII